LAAISSSIEVEVEVGKDGDDVWLRDGGAHDDPQAACAWLMGHFHWWHSSAIFAQEFIHRWIALRKAMASD
jgi:hypothetical protein